MSHVNFIPTEHTQSASSRSSARDILLPLVLLLLLLLVPVPVLVLVMVLIQVHTDGNDVISVGKKQSEVKEK